MGASDDEAPWPTRGEVDAARKARAKERKAERDRRDREEASRTPTGKKKAAAAAAKKKTGSSRSPSPASKPASAAVKISTSDVLMKAAVVLATALFVLWLTASLDELPMSIFQAKVKAFLGQGNSTA